VSKSRPYNSRSKQQCSAYISVVESLTAVVSLLPESQCGRAGKDAWLREISKGESTRCATALNDDESRDWSSGFQPGVAIPKGVVNHFGGVPMYSAVLRALYSSFRWGRWVTVGWCGGARCNAG